MKKAFKIIFFLYLLLLVKVIVFKYPFAVLREIVAGWSGEVIWEGMNGANFTLFKTIKMYLRYADRLNSFENLVGNVAAFLPFGFLFPLVLARGRNFLVLFFHVLLFVVGIEIFQLFSAFGVFDVDDILLNCGGAVMGWMLYFVTRQKIFGKNIENVK